MTEMTIKAGVDSIREFTVPTTLPGASLNAPTNSGAVIASTGSEAKPTVPTTPVVTPPVPTPQVTEALPEAGASTTFLIFLAAISAFGLLLVRKRT